MAETGCLRNASYHHVSVQGNLNATDSRPKNLRGEISGETYNLKANDCGIITLGVMGEERLEERDGGFNVNLPIPRKGLYYKFILIHTGMEENTDITIYALNSNGEADATDLIVGSVTKLGGGNDSSNHSGRMVYGSTLKGKKIIFRGAESASVEGCQLGDSCELFCDGANWFMKGECLGDDRTIAAMPIELIS